MRKLVIFVFLSVLLFSGCQPDWLVGGNIHLQGGRYDRAIAQYEEGVRKNPDSYVPFVSLAAAYYMKKEFKVAVDYLDKAIEMDKKGAEGKIQSYEGLLNTKYLKWQIYYNGAVEYFEDEPQKALDLAKKSLDVEDKKKMSLSYSLLARMMLNSGKKEEARDLCKKAIEEDKNNIEPYLYLGRYYLTERELDEALKCFNEVLSIDSTKVEVYELIGQAYLLKKQHSKAIELLEKALSITGKSPAILYNLMFAHYENEDYNEVMKKGKEVLELENVQVSVLTNVYNLLGQTYETKEDYKNAVAVMKEAIDKGVNNCDSYSIMAHAYYKLGKLQESNSWSKKWEECDKNK